MSVSVAHERVEEKFHVKMLIQPATVAVFVSNCCNIAALANGIRGADKAELISLAGYSHGSTRNTNQVTSIIQLNVMDARPQYS